MPWPNPTYPGGQDDDRTRSIDVVHIEPSIREGLVLVSSLYGPDASAPIERFPPVSSDNAWIRGNPVIPSLLTAEEGTWNWSPTGYFEYQWMADGVDIAFATNKTWMSDPAYDGQQITVEIRGINPGGQDITISSALGISILEPIELRDFDEHIITGMPQGNLAQTTRDERTIILSGMAGEDRLDVNRAVAYFATGMAGEDRNDVNAMNIPIITGIQQTDVLAVLEKDWSIGVVNYEYADALVDGVPVAMNLKNYNAEMGTIGWNIFGTVWYVDDDHHEGNLSWNGGENVHAEGSNTPFSYMWQDVPIESIWEADVDAGLCNLELYWYQFSEETQDMANMRVEFYDVNDTLLGQDNGPGLWASPNDIWFRRSLEDAIPPLTRYVRIFGEFNLQSGNNNDAGIDTVTPFIRKGAKVDNRDYGPNFEQWRIRFTFANTWSGTGLSELEFRATEGGTDLATGGQPIFGSAGLGVSNADYAFDDLINTGYWAGEENGIANGTAWIGYDKQAPMRPQEVAITARAGSDSLQVGREFYIEGSDDGIRWTKVQFVNETLLGTFTSEQTKEIAVPQGAFDYFTAYHTGAGYLYSRDIYTGDDYAGKGAVFEAQTRLNITHIRAMIDDNSLTPFDFRIQLCRVNNQKSGGWQSVGMVYEVLEDLEFTSAGVNGGLTWVEAACSETYEFEVGDWFLVRFYDMDAASNPVDANEGRTRWISNWNGEDTPFVARKGVANRVTSWNGGGQTPYIGWVNPSGYNGGGAGVYWAVDFKGSIF